MPALNSCIMPIDKPASLEPGEQGSSLANALRDCFICGAVLIEAGDAISAITPDAAQMLGLSASPASSWSLDVLPLSLQAVVAEARASGQGACERAVEVPVAGQQSLWLRASATTTPPGKPTTILILRGQVSAGEIGARLRQLDRLARLGTLSSAMAHEIRNALVPAKTMVELLLEKNRDAELADLVRRELDRMDGIVSRMLKFAGNGRREFGQIRLHTVLERCLRLIEPALREKDIAIERSFGAERDEIPGNDAALEQAFVNLFLNAIEAMGTTGKLTVVTEVVAAGAASGRPGELLKEPQMRIVVRDTGAGIAPEDMARLFEPFFTTKANGTGLGLAITRNLVHEHGGRIEARSDPGQGTAFTILLRAQPSRG